MKKVAVLGAGKIGALISWLLAHSGDYQVHVGDLVPETLRHFERELSHPNLHAHPLDIKERPSLVRFLSQNQVDAVISALPFYCNRQVAEVAGELNLHYFDLTEDVEVARAVRKISERASTAFVPQCGLAPGFISIAASDIMCRFEELNTVRLRVGALPQNPSNGLKYALTWSTNGLINQYANPCQAIENGLPVILQSLEGYENIELDGSAYEAFNTSGGLGTLAETYSGRVKKMNYKTIRYPGHCEKMRFLMNDLELRRDRDTLARILENAVPRTLQDVVLVYVSVTGKREGAFFEESFVKKLYPQKIENIQWTAIQVTTAASACAVVDLVLQGKAPGRGFVTQESIPLSCFLENRFGQYYR
jgi:saccharopine dehydrogenase-like NADP-dependent oxidoreductase